MLAHERFTFNLSCPASFERTPGLKRKNQPAKARRNEAGAPRRGMHVLRVQNAGLLRSKRALLNPHAHTYKAIAGGTWDMDNLGAAQRAAYFLLRKYEAQIVRFLVQMKYLTSYEHNRLFVDGLCGRSRSSNFTRSLGVTAQTLCECTAVEACGKLCLVHKTHQPIQRCSRLEL